ncbi:AI-2E family transporter [Scytonema sp. NUACC21]
MNSAKLICKPVFNTLQKHISPRWLMVMIFPILILNAWLAIKTLQYFQPLVAIAPRLLGRFTGLRPTWILIALFIGTKLFGWLGLVVSVPLAGFRHPARTSERFCGYRYWLKSTCNIRSFTSGKTTSAATLKEKQV